MGGRRAVALDFEKSSNTHQADSVQGEARIHASTKSFSEERQVQEALVKRGMLTVFSWGYWGWGNATQKLDKAITLAEERQGYRPPTFVDIRWNHQVRAKGFSGDAFRAVIGRRYHPMKDLGNDALQTGGVHIHRPGAVRELLRLAREVHDDPRRIIFYCSCKYPWEGGRRGCHRNRVTDLLLEQARTEGVALAVVEWPGGEPSKEPIGTIELERGVFGSLGRGARKSLPFDERRLGEFAGIPWGSLVTVKSPSKDQRITVPVGPPRFAGGKGGGWQLPICPDGKTEEELAAVLKKDGAALRKEVDKWRWENGFHKPRMA